MHSVHTHTTLTQTIGTHTISPVTTSSSQSLSPLPHQSSHFTHRLSPSPHCHHCHHQHITYHSSLSSHHPTCTTLTISMSPYHNHHRHITHHILIISHKPTLIICHLSLIAVNISHINTSLLPHHHHYRRHHIIHHSSAIHS
jgi:hypothetical protein